MLFIVGIFIAIFLSLLLLLKKNKSRADKILFIWLIFISINQAIRYLAYSGHLFEYPHWLGIEFSFPVLHAILLYFYVLEITGNIIKKNSTVLLYFLPALILVLLSIPFYQLTGVEKVNFYKNEGQGFEWFLITQGLVIVLFGLAYSIWSFVIIKRHKKKIEDRFSNTEKKELQWLKYLVIGNGVIYVLSLFLPTDITYSAVVIMILFIGFFGINQLNIFQSSSDGGENLDKENIKETPKLRAISKRYAKSGLNEETAAQIYDKLNVLMNGDALYKNEDLSLSELAKTLNAHPNHLSQVINEMEGKNFYNYINALRINEFIKLAKLPENKKYTMISLAYDVGFSSKSTFNKHFKANTGKTPTNFFKTEVVQS